MCEKLEKLALEDLVLSPCDICKRRKLYDGYCRRGDEPEETTRERQERIRALYEQRKAMRRLAKLCCVWVSGAAFVLAVIAAYGQMIDAAAVTAGVSLMTAGAGILL